MLTFFKWYIQFELRDAQWKTSVTGQTDCLVELLLNGFFLKYKIDADFLCTYNLSLYQHFLADATRQ